MTRGLKCLGIALIMLLLLALFLLGFTGLSLGATLLATLHAPLVVWFSFTAGMSLLALLVFKTIDVLEQRFQR